MYYMYCMYYYFVIIYEYYLYLYSYQWIFYTHFDLHVDLQGLNSKNKNWLPPDAVH